MVIPDHPFSPREKTVVDILSKEWDSLPDSSGTNPGVTLTDRLNRHGYPVYDDPARLSFLNVGFKNWCDPRVHWWRHLCEANQVRWDIQEIHLPNVSQAVKDGCPADRIQCSNILRCSWTPPDILLFWHGPEHLEKEEFLWSLPSIEQMTRSLVIFGMPLGPEPQDEVNENIHERHLNEWSPEEWHQLGYQTVVLDDAVPGVHAGHLTAWKRLEEKCFYKDGMRITDS